ncbi:hypothetical protein FOXG_20930 [Fusarium oxysporum f. sp. lycopersici 4287]|uniref:Chromo domain-containing protein n=1 Tax=Fusarium oxysporum f. sp. lycopersici (strain 4287 / CBS 123668 / FGSC 9935 / NRRL 34936) TaxID=426428 RepID=A0A0J9VS45_FUSO4|nr:hypothetical protein FOXG_20930 [Fusarium oxysporum f. sp. lycopersici 4287]EWZ79204.1 hypothetical protein FOWG_16649 [Fusarium oxysporum f. sp. lycopersici MN25]KAJ9413042.1 hypothetical protein QL093DRAFT_2026711 [Fusarium oxysporum]KNB13804.1 hypothetical protein FOXG_20930 [Fusarium oxysporum f. sp. lycopersici 4287]
MLNLARLECPGRGRLIQTPWSANVIIKKILVLTQVGGRILYGILAETQDKNSWDWLHIESLLWAFEDGVDLRMLHYTSRPSLLYDGDPNLEIEDILGHYEMKDGQCFFAVKWKEFTFPTWETELEMADFSNEITTYFHR